MKKQTEKEESGASHPGGTGSGGKAACTQPRVAKGMAGETKSQRAGEAAQAEIHKGAYGD